MAFDVETLPYHWDDRNRLHRDYLYLRDLHEKLLVELAGALNAVHDTHHSVRYWRILVGPWLQYFTQMLFDRWTTIQDALQAYEISATKVLGFSPERIIPSDMLDFRNMYSTDAWNHAIYSRILQGWTNVRCEPVSDDAVGPIAGPVLTPQPRGLVGRIKRSLAASAPGLLRVVARSTDAFLFSTHLGLKEELLLQLALGQVPIRYEAVPAPQVAPLASARRDLRLEAASATTFEECVRALIPEQIPTVYLEGYAELLAVSRAAPWPKKPKVVFTANGYMASDTFKVWAASRVEEGTPLVVGQHGGNLGSALWSSSEDHEVAIADRYLTWGWGEGDPKHYPVGALNRIGRRTAKPQPRGHLLLVASVYPRYSYVLGSFPTSASQTESYLQDQYDLVRALPKRIYEELVIRLFAPDWGWDQPARWRAQFPDARIDPGTAPIKSLVAGTRLYVATYNATTFLESLNANIPTIMFWNPAHSELRSSAEPFFRELERVGIFHPTAESAARKVAQVWDDITGWWRDPEIQRVRLDFVERFARSPQNPIRDLRRALTTAKPR
jgi:putative transferase (TIGR04331 family)